MKAEQVSSWRMWLVGMAMAWAVVCLAGCATVGPTGPGVHTDASLAADVRERLDSDPVTAPCLLVVRAMAGRVEVSGRVPDAVVAARVRAVVEGTPGVRSVALDLTASPLVGDRWRGGRRW